MIQAEADVLPKRETLCLTRADILQKILQKGRKEGKIQDREMWRNGQKKDIGKK